MQLPCDILHIGLSSAVIAANGKVDECPGTFTDQVSFDGGYAEIGQQSIFHDTRDVSCSLFTCRSCISVFCFIWFRVGVPHDKVHWAAGVWLSRTWY